MNKNTAKGTIDDAFGRLQRHAGEWTDDPEAQAEGAARQGKGKAEKMWGKIKDAVPDMRTDADRARKRPVQDERAPEHLGTGPDRTQLGRNAGGKRKWTKDRPW